MNVILTANKQLLRYEGKLTAPSEINRLLDGLPQKDKANLLAECEVVDLAVNAVLCEADLALRFVYFPFNGFISLVSGVDGLPALETGLIGNEGMLGATLALGINTSPLRGVVQGMGIALRTTAQHFRRALRDIPSVRRMSKQYLYVSRLRLSRDIACIHFHHVGPRLARLLLLIQDRAHADHFYLTHHSLAEMLGLQRSAVTIAAGRFQVQNLIRYSRGNITVLDRKGLESASCSCYQQLSMDYLKVFPVH